MLPPSLAELAELLDTVEELLDDELVVAELVVAELLDDGLLVDVAADGVADVVEPVVVPVVEVLVEVLVVASLAWLAPKATTPNSAAAPAAVEATATRTREVKGRTGGFMPASLR